MITVQSGELKEPTSLVCSTSPEVSDTEPVSFASSEPVTFRNGDQPRASDLLITGTVNASSSSDVRKLFKADRRGWMGSAIAFSFFFTSWTAWYALIWWWSELAGVEYYSTEMLWFVLNVNSLGLTITCSCAAMLVYFHGPLLSGVWRTLFAGSLLMSAIFVWCLIEAGIALVIGTSAEVTSIFYSACFLLTAVVAVLFGRVCDYDVVANHMI